MRRILESDVGFYYAVGAFIIAIFTVGIASLAVVDPAGIDRRTLLPLTVGFFMFMFVYFISISVQLLEPDEE